jgi:hypothetical protein
MKPTRDAAALAASLSKAATAPLPLPTMPPEAPAVPANTSIGPEETKIAAVTTTPAPKRVTKQKIVSDTVQVTLRPPRELLERYIIAAADRTRDEKKPISPQQIMLEVLEKGLRVKQ